MNFKNYFDELKRRNVFKAALAYVVVSWIIIQVASIVFPAFNASKAAIRTILIILIIGFPVWLVFAWVYEVTPEGLKKTEKVDRKESITSQTSNKFNKLILGALAIAIILLGVDVYGIYLHKDEPQAANTENVAPAKAEDNKPAETLDKSIAVLAFDDMSPKKDQEYFSDGISEEILNYLAKNPDLEVISRTSSFYFKDKEATTKEIGQKLHVNYLLEGSVRKAGDMVRITAQLINISTGNHIWSETYDRKLDDIFKIQDDIAAAVSKKLEASLLGEKTKEVNTDAFTLYLQARHLWEQSTNESLENALDLLKKANRIDSNYAPIWELMSEIYYSQGFRSPILAKEKAYELGFNAARKTVKIDPQYAMGYLELARWNMTQFDFEKAKMNAEKAIEIAPDNPEVLRDKGMMTFDSVSEMIRNDKKALKLDPLLYSLHRTLSVDNYWYGNYEEALKEMNIYMEYQPGTTATSSFKTMILLNLDKTEEAMEEINKEPDPFWKEYNKVKVLFQSGKKKDAFNLLNEFINAYPNETVNIADIYAFMGDREKTFEWLQKALEIKDPTLTEAVYYPTFKKFHDDPRWQQLLEEMGVPEENGIPGYKKS
ncbi:hypothetical protein C7S20_10690 [Christiangramia fulva]|uniref:FlgO domain-containing protein n=1 Tax=Christiangramia fulva TaxID=2126553 RepID=A0A2R3Z649_9FLAO|nr:hypothetical protein [Christiangramia fulva]AVR45684.1 hypothetical protein C7S20_10690 [Christiangramia fulva]